jgi:transposase
MSFSHDNHVLFEHKQHSFQPQDESGFYLLPMAVRTYAPVGQTPVLRVPLTRDHVSAIGALTPEGRLFMQTQDHSYKGENVVGFLNQLLRHIPGKLLIIWDGSPIHHCEAVKAFLRQGGAQRIHLERLPAYAPNLKPQEGVWNLLKRRELKNLCCKNLLQLDAELLLARARLRHRRHTLRHCFAHAGYSL